MLFLQFLVATINFFFPIFYCFVVLKTADSIYRYTFSLIVFLKAANSNYKYFSLFNCYCFIVLKAANISYKYFFL